MLLRLALPFRTLLGMRVISRCSASSCLPGSSYGCMPAFILVIGSCYSLFVSCTGQGPLDRATLQL